MNFIRPEVAIWLLRWRESLVGGGLVGIGLWMFWRGLVRHNLIFQAAGAAVAIVGFSIAVTSYRRTAFALGGGTSTAGPGVVEVTERRITYLTSIGGGIVHLDVLTRIELRNLPDGGRAWLLKQRGYQSILIPVDAVGSDQLFDVFSSLSGLEPDRLVAAVRSTAQPRTVVWQAK
jgi:hypothetical protein